MRNVLNVVLEPSFILRETKCKISNHKLPRTRGFPGGANVKSLPNNAGNIRDVVPFLGQEDSLEDGMATQPSTLLGESYGQRSLVGYSP